MPESHPYHGQPVLGWARRCGGLGAEVAERLNPHMGHTINQDEIDCVKGMMAVLVE